MATERRRGLTGFLIGLIIVVGLLWVGYWYAAHYFAGVVLARVTTQPVDGRKIDCRNASLGGFPLRLDLRCDSASYAEPGGRTAAELDGIVASVPLYWPTSVEASLTGPLTMSVPDRGVALTATWSRGSATAGGSFGGLTGVGAAFDSLSVENSGPLPGTGLTTIAAEKAGGSIAPAGSGSYALAASAIQLALTRAEGVLPPIDLDLRATAIDVGPLGADPARAFLAWLRGTPNATIDNLRLSMAGAIVSASGTLSLSGDGLLNGSILLRYNSIEGLANLIETLKPGTRDRYEVALQGLQSMSKPVDSPDGSALQTTVTFTDGLVWLTIIPLPIDPIPPIRF